jgi:hypothetical protein
MRQLSGRRSLSQHEIFSLLSIREISERRPDLPGDNLSSDDISLLSPRCTLRITVSPSYLPFQVCG